jgi:HPt (histidine-containing phosphotransfer) domain-containing protein
MDDLMSKPYTLEQCAQLLRHWIRGAARPQPADPDRRRQAGGDGVGADSAAGIRGAAEVDATTVIGLKSLRGGGHSDLYTKLVELFRPASTQSVDQLGSALRTGDFEAARSICHKLASSAGNVGALAFAKYVRQTEKACQERDTDRARHLYQTIRSAHPALIEELTRMQLRQSA